MLCLLFQNMQTIQSVKTNIKGYPLMKNYYLIGLILMLALLVSCNSQPDPEPTPEPEAVSLQLSWIHEYSSSMFPSADKEGFFAANGVDVTVIEGGFGANGFIDSVATVVDGTAEFGVTDGLRLIEARAEGHPLVAIANVMQRSPNAVISLEDAGIVRPEDLRGKRILVADGGANLLFSTLLESQSIDLSEVTIVPRTVFGIDPLLNGEADALMGWIINESVSIEEAGQTPSNILFTDYGIENYNFVLFTTEDMIANHPETVQGLVTGLLEGVQFVISNPETAIQHVLEFNSEVDEDAQLRRLQTAIPLMNVPGVPLGSMTPEIWNFMAQLLIEQGTIDESFDVSQAYTLDFLDNQE
jgi:NitT/TauT family transport system substrate-binding protein